MGKEYRESDIKWIGQIPRNWVVKKIDYMSSSRSGGTPNRDDIRYWENGEIPWMSSGEVNKVNIYETDEKITELAIRNSNAKMIKKESVMIALNGQGKTKGMSAILRIDSTCNQSLCAFTCFEEVLHYEYLFWCFQTMYLYLRQMSGDDVRDGLAASYVRKQKIPVPPFNEQIKIAYLLNKKIEKIDKITLYIENQIDILEKYRNSLITEVVTKGLDRTVSMKSSGIEWVGEIPITWKIVKVKYLATEKESLFIDGDWIESDVIEESGIRYLTTGNVGKGYFKEQGSSYISEKTFKELNCLKVLPNDLMISRLNEPIGRACLVPNGNNLYVVAVDNVILRPDKKYNKRFLMYVMNTNGYSENGNITARGATMSRISRSQLGQFWIAYPELSEQNLIVDYLDKRCKIIDSLIIKKKKKITTVQELKKSLVYEYVTGKKRVEGVINNGN